MSVDHSFQTRQYPGEKVAWTNLISLITQTELIIAS